jgi:hypothetical protein
MRPIMDSRAKSNTVANASHANDFFGIGRRQIGGMNKTAGNKNDQQRGQNKSARGNFVVHNNSFHNLFSPER